MRRRPWRGKIYIRWKRQRKRNWRRYVSRNKLSNDKNSKNISDVVEMGSKNKKESKNYNKFETRKKLYLNGFVPFHYMPWTPFHKYLFRTREKDDSFI